MDVMIVIVIVIFALIIIAAFLVFRQRSKIEIKGPLGTGLNLDASNDPPAQMPSVKVEGAKSRRGGLVAEDNIGRGAYIKDIDVQDDILVSSTTPPQTSDPKL